MLRIRLPYTWLLSVLAYCTTDTPDDDLHINISENHPELVKLVQDLSDKYMQWLFPGMVIKTCNTGLQGACFNALLPVVEKPKRQPGAWMRYNNAEAYYQEVAEQAEIESMDEMTIQEIYFGFDRRAHFISLEEAADRDSHELCIPIKKIIRRKMTGGVRCQMTRRKEDITPNHIRKHISGRNRRMMQWQ
jgi:hypothetical protein